MIAKSLLGVLLLISITTIGLFLSSFGLAFSSIYDTWQVKQATNPIETFINDINENNYIDCNENMLMHMNTTKCMHEKHEDVMFTHTKEMHDHINCSENR